MQMGIWRVTGSTRLHNLTVGSVFVFNSTSSGNKLVGTCNRVGIKFASKFNGMFLVKSQLFKLSKGGLNNNNNRSHQHLEKMEEEQEEEEQEEGEGEEEEEEEVGLAL
eukprot:884144-Pelagomonas_calceolata.AAC.2